MPHFRSHSLHLPFYHSDDNKNLRILFGIRIIRDLVAQFSFFFFPIFLYNFSIETGLLDFLGLPNISTGMLGIAIYYLLARVLMFVISIPVGQILHYQGCHRGMLYAFLARSIQLALLFLSSYNPYLILLIILMEALQAHFFWNSYFTILSKNSLNKNVGKDLGMVQFLVQLVKTITPAISGMVALAFGFNSLFIVGLLFALVGVTLGMMIHMPFPQDKPTFSEFFRWLKDKQYEQFAISFPGKYINDSVMFLWPLYVFFFLGSVDKVGFLYTISLFAAMMFTFFFGNIIDHAKSKKPFFASGSFLSLLWLFRTQVWNVWSIALVDAFDRLTSNFHWLFFDSIFMKRGKGRKAMSFFVYSEITKSIIGMLFWTGVAILFLLDIGWNAVFITAAVGVLATLFIDEKHRSAPERRV